MFRLNFWAHGSPWGFPASGYPPPPLLPPTGCYPPLPPLRPPLGFAPWMETSPTTLPSPMASPALMVLATTAEAAAREGRDPGGLNKPQDPQDMSNYPYAANGTKNICDSFPTTTTTTATYQNGHQFQGFASFVPPPVLPPHLAYPQFAPPDAEHSMVNPTGDGAFKPPTKLESDPGSAFVAAKKPKIEEENGEAQQQSERTTEDGETREVTIERPDSVGSRSSEGTNPDESRFLRRTVRKRTEELRHTLCCPVCGVTMRPGDMTSHLMVEIEKLNKLSKPRKSLSKEPNPNGKKNPPGPSAPANTAATSKGEVTNGELPGNRYDTYLRVRASRQTRLAARSKGKKKKSGEETVCPVCSEKIVGTTEELNEHVDQCLKQKGEDDEDVDVEGEFEEYTWAGQTRIRATSFVEGGLAEAGFKKISKSAEDEDVDLCVDDDDVDTYGTPQYTEADIIPCSTEDPNEDKQSRALRRAYLRAEKLKAQKPELTDRVRWQHSNEPSVNSNSEAARTTSPDGARTDSSCGTPNPVCSNEGALEEVIESLKVKIKEQEEQLANKQEPPKCLICMEIYHKPTTSVQCWHVHCEECWLRTLGAKKLCPQCNMITSPADLRRIYL